MWVAKVEKKRPKPQLPAIVQSVTQQVVEDLRRETVGHEPSKPTHGQPETCMLPSKLEYTLWIEKIKERFKVGDLVTWANTYYVPGALPKAFYRIANIEEIHYLVIWDFSHRQHRAIYIADGPYKLDHRVCPCEIRKLNDEELKLVHASSSTPGVNDDGKSIIVSDVEFKR